MLGFESHFSNIKLANDLPRGNVYFFLVTAAAVWRDGNMMMITMKIMKIIMMIIMMTIAVVDNR